MATETTEQTLSPRSGAREAGQEYASGTVDLDGTGAGSITVSLSGDLSDTLGVGVFAGATTDDGTATTSSLTNDSVDVDISGGTADATVSFTVVVSEDPFAL